MGKLFLGFPVISPSRLGSSTCFIKFNDDCRRAHEKSIIAQRMYVIGIYYWVSGSTDICMNTRRDLHMILLDDDDSNKYS